MCIGAARMHAVGAICYAARDPVAGSAGFATMTPFMQRWPISVTGPQDEVLEAALLALHTDFNLRHGAGWTRASEQVRAYAGGVLLGRWLVESGNLVQRATAGVQAPELLDWLAQLARRSL
jgi:hypothetical protein